jgi:hypothetical protein
MSYFSSWISREGSYFVLGFIQSIFNDNNNTIMTSYRVDAETPHSPLKNILTRTILTISKRLLKSHGYLSANQDIDQSYLPLICDKLSDENVHCLRRLSSSKLALGTSSLPPYNAYSS